MNQITIISVSTGSARYEVEIGLGLLPLVGARVDALLGGALSSGKVRAFVVTSPEIWKLHGEQLSSGFVCPPTALMVESGEEHKRLATVERLAEQLSEAGADRDSLLIAFAGGVVGDMTGFLAAAYMRGIRYVQVPTTLLAQVDSAIGGKTGVNLSTGKNLFGAFHHPLAVYADTAVLGTLPPEQLRAGLQESIKAGIIRDPALFDVLERHFGVILDEDADPEFAEHEAALTLVVAASVRVKAEIVSADEREGGLRMVLNLGHTLGHAIEAATHYKALLHGEAVAWGMIAATDIALQRKLVSAEDALRINRVIRFYGPLKPFEASVEELVALTARDKKNRSGSRSFVLPVGIGNAMVVRDVTVEELTRATERMMALVARVRAGELEA